MPRYCRRPTVVCAFQAETPVVMECAFGRSVVAMPGEWIITEVATRDVCVLPDEKFRRYYEPLEGPSKESEEQIA